MINPRTYCTHATPAENKRLSRSEERGLTMLAAGGDLPTVASRTGVASATLLRIARERGVSVDEGEASQVEHLTANVARGNFRPADNLFNPVTGR